MNALQMDGSIEYPTAEELVEQCGKFHLLDRLLTRLKARGHKVLIFSQARYPLQISARWVEAIRFVSEIGGEGAV